MVPVLALLAALTLSSPAAAVFTPFQLVSADSQSANPPLQADYAYDPAISADGRYVAFTGSVGSVPGVYRKDTVTGALALVAAGERSGAPSISANGQYVSFTTDDNPVTGRASGQSCTSVYVRNMANEPPAPQHEPPTNAPDPWEPEESEAQAASRPFSDSTAAFTLVSARDGSNASLTYLPPAVNNPYPQACGAASAARVALSADGTKVAFTVLTASDLTGPCKEEEHELLCPTPPEQVAVRDLAARSTTLVSTTLASLGKTSEPVGRGAALSGPSYVQTSLPNGGSAILPLAASTAAISADGSTVAWMGVDVDSQAPVAKPIALFNNFIFSYAEPLWRRIADGPGAPTRRVLAGDDASAPQCPPTCPGGLDLLWDTEGISGEEYFGAAPLYGSYISQAKTSNGFIAGSALSDSLAAVTPQLSADGMTVALLSTQPDYGHDPEFGQNDATLPPPANAFVVNMAPGLTRAQAIRRLTDWASLEFANPELSSPITSIAISGDGSRVTFTTERIAFPLAPPALITPTLSQAGVTQMYEVNLAGGTLSLVTFGYDEQPANGGVFATALSENGERIALASGATNLVYGVVNEGSAVFLTEEEHSPTVPGQQAIGPLPPWPAAAVPWSLSATATPSPDGTLVVYATVPGAGRVSASATPVTAGEGSDSGKTRRRASVRSRRHSRAQSKSAARPTARSAATTRHATTAARGRRRKQAQKHKGRKPASTASMVLGRAGANAAGPTTVELHLIPAKRYDSLLTAPGGLYAKIVVTFTAPGHAPLTQTLYATFPRRPTIYDLPASPYSLPPYALPKHRAPAHVKPRRAGHRKTTHKGGHR